MTQATLAQANAQAAASNTIAASPSAAVPVSNATVVDVADNSTTVSPAPALLLGIYVNTVLSNHALPIKDGADTIITLPAQTAAGAYLPLPGVRFNTSIVVDPDDAATGNVTLFWVKQ
jgi:hypothetical protein